MNSSAEEYKKLYAMLEALEAWHKYQVQPALAERKLLVSKKLSDAKKKKKSKRRLKSA